LLKDISLDRSLGDVVQDISLDASCFDKSL
jgi:hypothetical protein